MRLRSASITAPDPFVLHNFLAFPGTVNSAVDSLTADANYRIRLIMGDIDYKCAIVNNNHVLLNWLAGVRYARLEQDLNSTFQITGTTTVDANIDFDGVGPRIEQSSLGAIPGFAYSGPYEDVKLKR